MKKPFVITTSISKGGAGKTTVASLLIASLAEKGFKVLGIDTDQQMNLSNSFGLTAENPEDRTYSTFNFIMNSFKEDYDVTAYIRESEYENVDMIIAESTTLHSIDAELLRERYNSEFFMKEAVKKIEALNAYDFIIIDTPPSVGTPLLSNAYVASDYIIVPVACEAFSLDGITGTFAECIKARAVNPDLGIGFVMNRVDKRTNITKAVIEATAGLVGDHAPIFKTQFRVDTKIAESQLLREPLLAYNKRSKGVEDAHSLAEEVYEIATTR